MFVELEGEIPVGFERQFLDELPTRVLHADRERVRADFDVEVADGALHRFRHLAKRQRRFGVSAINHRGCRGEVLFERHRFQRDPDRVIAGGADVELRGLSGRRELW